MNSVAGVLQRSMLTNVNSKKEAHRRKELLEIQNPAKRAAALMLHHLAIHHPDMVGRVIGMQPRTGAVRIVGEGLDTIVYKTDEQTVKKVHRSSLAAELKAQQQTVEYKAGRNAVLRAALPSFTLPQSTYIGEHPYYVGRAVASVVITQQEFLPQIIDTKLFKRGQDTEVLADGLQPFLKETHLRDQLQDFIGISRDFARQDGYVPDILGKSNFVITDSSKLVLIDGQPLARDSPSGDRVISRLDYLEAAIS